MTFPSIFIILVGLHFFLNDATLFLSDHPNRFKVGFRLFFIIDYVSIPWMFRFWKLMGTYYLLIIKEVLVGFLLVLLLISFLSAIQIAGGFIDFQMGFAMANVMDPQTGAQSPIMGQYLYIFALLFLLSVNGHHLLLDGIFYSYQFIPMIKLDSTWS